MATTLKEQVQKVVDLAGGATKAAPFFGCNRNTIVNFLAGEKVLPGTRALLELKAPEALEAVKKALKEKEKTA